MTMADQDPKKFCGQYRIATTRAQWWDYRRNAAYFITICTADNKIHHFGHVENGKMILPSTGIIADILWHETEHHRIAHYINNNPKKWEEDRSRGK